MFAGGDHATLARAPSAVRCLCVFVGCVGRRPRDRSGRSGADRVDRRGRRDLAGACGGCEARPPLEARHRARERLGRLRRQQGPLLRVRREARHPLRVSLRLPGECAWTDSPEPGPAARRPKWSIAMYSLVEKQSWVSIGEGARTSGRLARPSVVDGPPDVGKDERGRRVSDRPSLGSRGAPFGGPTRGCSECRGHARAATRRVR